MIVGKTDYSKAQIIDLIYIKQNSCKGRFCGECIWMYKLHEKWKCRLSEKSVVQVTENREKEVKKNVIKILKKYLFGEAVK